MQSLLQLLFVVVGGGQGLLQAGHRGFQAGRILGGPLLLGLGSGQGGAGMGRPLLLSVDDLIALGDGGIGRLNPGLQALV